MPRKTVKVELIISGETSKHRLSLRSQLGDAVKKAAMAAGHYLASWHGFEIRDRYGVLLEEAREVAEFDFADGARLWVSPPVGVNG